MARVKKIKLKGSSFGIEESLLIRRERLKKLLIVLIVLVKEGQLIETLKLRILLEKIILDLIVIFP